MIKLVLAYYFEHGSGLVVAVESMPWSWLGSASRSPFCCLSEFGRSRRALELASAAAVFGVLLAPILLAECGTLSPRELLCPPDQCS